MLKIHKRLKNLIPTELQRFCDRVEFDFCQPASIVEAFELMGLVAPQIFPLMECQFLSFGDWMTRIDEVTRRWSSAKVLHADNFSTKAAPWINSVWNTLGFSYPNIVKISGQSGECRSCGNVIFPSFEYECASCGTNIGRSTASAAATVADAAEAPGNSAPAASVIAVPIDRQADVVSEHADPVDVDIPAVGVDLSLPPGSPGDAVAPWSFTE